MAKRKTHEEYLKELKENKIKVLPIENYQKSRIKIQHICYCGNDQWFVSPNNVLRGRTCGCKWEPYQLKTHEQYVTELKEKDLKARPLEPYKTGVIKIRHLCECGNDQWFVSPRNVLNGRKCGCTKGDKKRFTHEKYLIKLKEKNIEVKPLELYIGIDKPIMHLCICKEKWKISPNCVLRGNKCGCKKSLSQALSHKEYLLRLAEKKIKVKPLEHYKSSQIKILHLCTCGVKWSVNPANVLNGRKCGCVSSIGENTIVDFLKKSNFNYEQQLIFPNLKSQYGRSLKYDFALKKKGKIFCLIEYQGKPHYEFIPHFHKNFFRFFDFLERDKLKRDYAQQKGIPLIEIPYWENTIDYLVNELRHIETNYIA